MGGRTSHNRRARLAGAACLLAVLCRAASGAETDQFLLWDRELADAAPEINAFLNDAVGDFLERANARSRPYRTPEAATIALFKYLFAGLHGSRVRTFVNTSPEVDRYPPRDTSIWRYQRMSLYHGLSFPFVLPMGRTVRVGEVYLGSDKFGHLLGFGRRYFQRYLRHRAHGASHDEAVDRVIDWGRVNEVSFVGGITDGIIAHADLEANYQGLRLALDCARSPAPYLARRDGQWVLTRPIDLRDYITPDFDESWNVCHFMGQRCGGSRRSPRCAAGRRRRSSRPRACRWRRGRVRRGRRGFRSRACAGVGRTSRRAS